MLNLDELCTSLGVGSPDQSAHRSRVLLELWMRDGCDGLPRLNGALHLVIWDKETRRLSAYTSKSGQRILYFSEDKGSVAFASEAQALPALTGRPLALDRKNAWMSFLYGQVLGSATSFSGVKKALPGGSLTVTGTTVRETGPAETRRSEPGAPARSLHQHLQTLDRAMQRSLTRIESVGQRRAVLMGSGVDSSVIAAYSAQTPGRALCVTQAMPEPWDEAPQAKRMSGRFGLEHRVIPYRPGERNLVDELTRFVGIIEEPAYWNQLGAPLMELAGAIEGQADGFLTGAEGDLLFNAPRTEKYSLRRFLRYGAFWATLTYATRIALNRLTRRSFIVGSDFELLDRALMRSLMVPELTRAEEEAQATARDFYPQVARGRTPLRHFLVAGWQNVRIISQVAQAHGAEALLPYLDDDVARAILDLPDELKINKFALRRLLAKAVPPREVPWKKRGYWAQTIQWYHEAGQLGSALDLLAEATTLERGLFDERELKRLIAAFRGERVDPCWYPILWQVLVFEVFCRRCVDRGSVIGA